MHSAEQIAIHHPGSDCYRVRDQDGLIREIREGQTSFRQLQALLAVLSPGSEVVVGQYSYTYYQGLRMIVKNDTMVGFTMEPQRK